MITLFDGKDLHYFENGHLVSSCTNCPCSSCDIDCSICKPTSVCRHHATGVGGICVSRIDGENFERAGCFPENSSWSICICLGIEEAHACTTNQGMRDLWELVQPGPPRVAGTQRAAFLATQKGVLDALRRDRGSA